MNILNKFDIVHQNHIHDILISKFKKKKKKLFIFLLLLHTRCLLINDCKCVKQLVCCKRYFCLSLSISWHGYLCKRVWTTTVELFVVEQTERGGDGTNVIDENDVEVVAEDNSIIISSIVDKKKKYIRAIRTFFKLPLYDSY